MKQITDMLYAAQIESIKQKLAETKQAIKVLQTKKATITDAAELKAINKQINALPAEIGKPTALHMNRNALLLSFSLVERV